MEEIQPVSLGGRFTRRMLPWAIAAGALAVYLATLNHWVSTGSLAYTAAAAGWSSRPVLVQPLYWLATYPLRWLPAAAIPLGLNVFSAVCAALTLALLARSTSLLPHDRTHSQRLRERSEFSLLSIWGAWLPPVLAVVLCGLQLTFWENATAASSEMLDLLVFAYVIRCLLEYRIDERPSWLMRAAFVYGLGITNNWAMAAFLPAFLVALVWIKGLGFFEMRFLTRVFLCGLCGMMLYMLLPLTQSLGHGAPVSFWQALKSNLGNQTTMVLGVFQHRRHELLVIGLSSLLPVLIIGIRWAPSFGDSSPLGVTLATVTFHIVHALFLGACVWVALDPPFSPRNMSDWGLPSLPAYYLGALGAGYFSGYFLLVFRKTGERSADRLRRPGPWLGVVNGTATAAVWLLLPLAGAVLLYRNMPQIRTTNGPMLENYASYLAQGLPAHNVVVLSDDSARSWLLQSFQATHGGAGDLLLLDTALLRYPYYHTFLKSKFPKYWTFDIPKDRDHLVSEGSLIRDLYTLSEHNVLYYLHPSFGYYFEFFYQEAHGVVYKLDRYATNALVAPPLQQAVVDENQAFWARAGEEVLKPLLAAITPPAPSKKPGLVEGLMARARLKFKANREASVLAAWCSRDVDSWGVELQKRGQLEEAGRQFELAQELNPENRAAQLNVACNRRLRGGSEADALAVPSDEDIFGPKIRNSWAEALRVNGPYDEPTCCYLLGDFYLRATPAPHVRQAAALFERAVALAPGDLDARLRLGQLYVDNNMPDEALKLIGEIRSAPERFALGRTNEAPVLLVEMSADLAKKDVPATKALVQRTVSKYPGDEDMLAAATSVYIRNGFYSNALETVDQELQISPEDPLTLYVKAYTCLCLKAFDQAIPAFTQVLQIETNNFAALRGRAGAYLSSSQWDAARRDYEDLIKLNPSAYLSHFGLGEAAYKLKDTNTAIKEYEVFLASAPTNTVQAQTIAARVKELKSPPH
jgi:tetratricopeptide (TPR) repeat protein